LAITIINWGRYQNQYWRALESRDFLEIQVGIQGLIDLGKKNDKNESWN